jgi:hypothetical protein
MMGYSVVVERMKMALPEEGVGESKPLVDEDYRSTVFDEDSRQTVYGMVL